MITLDIDTKALAGHVATLRSMHRSKLPVAVRQTITKAAYDVKQTTMPAASAVFTHRKPTFFKSNSKVEAAKGFDINTMQATVGFIPKADATDTAVADLEQQEEGGAISGRAFIPLAKDRVGNKWTGNVRAAGRFRAVQNKIVDAHKSKAPNPAGQFRSTAKYGGVGSLVIGSITNSKGNRMVWRIDRLGKKMKLTALFALKPGRKVAPPATHFMRKASIVSAKKMGRDFKYLAEIQIYKSKK